MNRDLPLGLPQGSVRSIIALALTGTVCALWLMGRPVPVELLGFAGGVVAFYFKLRNDSALTTRKEP
jgi:hypothetical protein